MTRILNSWIGRKKSKQKSRKRRNLRRRLRTEPLESRQLLAAGFLHNGGMPEDVNNDGRVSSLDALVIMNSMNRQTPGDTEMFTDVNNDGRRSAVDALMVMNRIRRGRGGPEPNQPPANQPAPDDPRSDAPADDSQTPSDPTSEVRTIDGSNNNLQNPELGSTDTPLLRVADADYADGVSTPAGADRPSAREISNLLSAADPAGTANERDLSAYLFMWGQFLDHDIDLSLHGEGDEAESFDIEVPAGDALFDPFGTGEATIPLIRSVIDPDTGTSADNPAEQVNAITTWIDGSQIYGSDEETASALREFVGGRLLITEDGLLPTDEEGNILAGDIRAAENIALTSMHALWVREHNRVAAEIAADNPGLSDEEIYQQARAIVIGELQAITYNEFLPALLGDRALARYQGYDESVDASIANEFSTAAFRFGHSTLTDELGFTGNDGLAVSEAVSLANAFFNPSMLEDTGIDSILKYGASTVSQEIDLQVVDSLRNFLFGPPGAGGLDLVSLNIQRGRDHGLADYNTTRVAYGLDAYDSFQDLTSDTELQANLQSLYGNINNVDLWVGLLAEDHLRDASVGELTSTIIADQFQRLRDGDRFWYENVFSGQQLREIDNTTLADVIERNTNLDSLQRNVFVFNPTISGTVTPTQAAAQSAAQASAQTDSRQSQRRRGDNRGGSPASLAGMTLQLLDASGDVIDTAVTDRNGQYRFDSLTSTGLYQVRMAADNGVDVIGSDTLSMVVASGDTRLDGFDFEVIM